MTAALYHGVVRHVRHGAVRHRFAYRVFTCLFDLDALPALAAKTRLFAHNRFALFSFHDRDHGPRDGSALRPWLEALARRHGHQAPIARVRVLCFPRILGFVFNPLTIYWCDDDAGRPRLIVYEVKNTHGEQHCYVHALDGGTGPARHESAKTFFVSPFIGMDARYGFSVRAPGETLSVLIRERDGAGADLLTASLTGARGAFGDRALLGAFWRYPLMTLKVIAAIHWEAIRLWTKGAPFHAHVRAAPAKLEG